MIDGEQMFLWNSYMYCVSSLFGQRERRKYREATRTIFAGPLYSLSLMSYINW